jgi:hypothetical protein
MLCVSVIFCTVWHVYVLCVRQIHDLMHLPEGRNCNFFFLRDFGPVARQTTKLMNCIRTTQPPTSPLLTAIQVSRIFSILMVSDSTHLVYSPSYIPFRLRYFYFHICSAVGQLNLGHSLLVFFLFFHGLFCYIKCDGSNHGSLTDWSDSLSSYREFIVTSNAA